MTVAIDILDEDHSLQLAMRRLGSDADLRSTLASAGQTYWDREHSHERMLSDYRSVIDSALEQPARDVRMDVDPSAWPVHLKDSAAGTLNALLAPFDIDPGDSRVFGALDSEE